MIRFNKASITELEKKNVIDAMENSISVSYTHLDVYKRQIF